MTMASILPTYRPLWDPSHPIVHGKPRREGALPYIARKSVAIAACRATAASASRAASLWPSSRLHGMAGEMRAESPLAASRNAVLESGAAEVGLLVAAAADRLLFRLMCEWVICGLGGKDFWSGSRPRGHIMCLGYWGGIDGWGINRVFVAWELEPGIGLREGLDKFEFGGWEAMGVVISCVTCWDGVGGER
jgi:hypothetical protein